jgi:hypothetical protein
MSGSKPNELTVYLRPQEAIQPYVVVECAKWMARTGRAKCTCSAMKYLIKMDAENPQQFKHMISEYHRHNDYHSQSATNFRKNINATYSVPGGYGEEAHMYYNRTVLPMFL